MATLKNLTVSDTGFVQLPVGTTGQRGAVGETCVQWTTGGYTLLQGSLGSGGAASATSWTCPTGVTSIRLLMVGGGGGGGGDVGGGGGGGGLIYYASYAVTPGNVYNLSIGAAGSGGANTPTQGGTTVFNGINAYGGAGGGFWSNGAPVGTPSTMGSGGGQTSNYSGGAHTPTTGQGNSGGVGGYNTSPGGYEYSGASGGGGAGAPGGDGLKFGQATTSFEGSTDMSYTDPRYSLGWYAGTTRVGYGGDGLAFDISGSVQYYAGGGGACSDGNTYWAYGGKGGGGRGGPGDGTSAATYYGGGGGGAGAPNTGGNGYQGVIIISYNTVMGEMRHNSTTGFAEMLGAGSGWETLGKRVNASGGTSTTSGGYTIRTYTGPGTFTMNSPGTIEALVVAGGGGGGSISGGGGAGGLVYQSRLRLNAGVYPVTVGTGGSGATNWYNNTLNPGNPSVFATVEAIGGGAAANYTYNNPSDGYQAWPGYKANGGSGGGGPGGHWNVGSGHGGVHGNPGNSTGNVAVNFGGTGVIGQGHPGGSGTHGYGWGFPNSLIYAGGGGGGAGYAGGHISEADRQGTGGRGMAVSISGSTAHYAGGGGGGVHQPGGISHYGRAYAAGGQGGGGAAGGPGVDGVTGSPNTGGGGGGGYHSGPNVAGGGGPGIVVIRHL
jgi:hypothetical protein